MADAYDAMTHDRPYRKALSDAQVMEELSKNAGTQFDPEIVKVFLDGVLEVKPEGHGTQIFGF